MLGRCALLLLMASLAMATPALAQRRGGGPGGGGPGGGGDKIDHKGIQSPPIQMGTSGGNATDIANGFCSSGTIGALLQDEAASPNYFMLSNSHVFAHDITSGGNADTADIGDPIIQPGLVDVACNAANAQSVGVLATFSSLVETVPGSTVLVSNVDASVAQVGLCGVGPCVQEDGAILGIGPISSSVINALIGQNVKKSGRTTGVTTSTVDSLNATINVTYSDEANGGTFTRSFSGQIILKNRRSKFLNSGDSGSLMVEDTEGTPRPIGLLYAGSNTIAVANPADHVLTYLNSGNTIHGIKTGSLSFVGAPVGGAAETQPAGMGRAIAAQEANAVALSSVPRGVGHAVSSQNGIGIIKVLVEEITPEVRQAAPTQIDGVPVVLEAVGTIVGF